MFFSIELEIRTVQVIKKKTLEKNANQHFSWIIVPHKYFQQSKIFSFY